MDLLCRTTKTKGLLHGNSPNLAKEDFMMNNKGFSLVELIVVIAIMAILASVAVVSYSVYIDRAQNAVDERYLADVIYRAELYAIENQVELDRVIVAPLVDSADDIKLVINTEDGQTVTWADEIFDSVGGYTFGKKYHNGMYDPTAPDPDIQDGVDDTPTNQPDQPDQPATCTHENCDVVTVDSTCKVKGTKTSTCKDCGHTEVQTLPLGDHQYTKVAEQDGFAYHVCDDCGRIIIKSTNGTAIVPIG